MSAVLVGLGLLVSVAGCKRTERPPAESDVAPAQPAGQRPAPPPAPRVVPPSQNQIRRHQLFCDRAAPLAMVREMTGVASLVPRRIARPERQVGECQYYSHDAGSVEIAVVADCRPQHPRRASFAASLAGAPDYRELAVGDGGFYTFQSRVHRTVFVREQPGCAVYVTAVGVNADPTVALAGKVNDRLTADTMPR